MRFGATLSTNQAVVVGALFYGWGMSEKLPSIPAIVIADDFGPLPGQALIELLMAQASHTDLQGSTKPTNSVHPMGEDARGARF